MSLRSALECAVPRPSPTTLLIAPRATSAYPVRVSVPSLPEDSDTRAQLERILNSRSFTGAHRSQLFLRYIVEHALAHPDEPLKEYSIACDVFGRGAYDPAVNNSVRVEAARLRSRLLEYYAGEGHGDPLLIEVPRGAYRPVIRSAVPAATRPLTAPPLRALGALTVAFILGAFLGYRASH